MSRLIRVVVPMFVVVTACSDQPTSPDSSSTPLQVRAPSVSDPTAKWKIPLTDTGLALKSDGQEQSGAYSVYADGSCGVAGRIFATTAGSNSGDATLQTGAGKKGCVRRFTIAYPDGPVESVRSFNNLHELQSSSYVIPVGATVERRLGINPGSISSNPSRCDRLHFGIGAQGGGVGSDMVLVTRTSASTWAVESKPFPDNKVLCEANNTIYNMTVSFVIEANRALPLAP